MVLASLSTNELLLVVVVFVLVFGASQLPKLARSLGQAQKEFKTGLNEGATEETDSPS